MKIFMEIAKVLNFTYKFKELSDMDKWGQRLSNGTYVGGIMAELTHGKSEVGFCSIWVSYYQSLVIDYTVTWGKVCCSEIITLFIFLLDYRLEAYNLIYYVIINLAN